MQRIKRGSILKGKSKLFSRLFVGVMSLLLATVICFASIVLNKTKYADAAVSNGEAYSQKDEGDIVLSVEKIGIISTGDDYTDSSNYDSMQNFYASSSYPFKGQLFTDLNATQSANSLYVDNIRAGVAGFPKYYYTNIRNGSNSKTVYHSGDYIMVENSLKTKNINGTNYTYYYSPKIKGDTAADSEVDMAEGVLFSFGSYILGTRSNEDG